MSNLAPTYGNCTMVGTVSGLSGDKAFSEGKSTSEWKKVQFTINTSKTSRIYVELMGSKQKDIKFVKQSKDKKQKEEKTIPWAKRYEDRNDEFKMMMPIKVGLEKDPEDEKKNLIKELTAYDAVDYIKKYLKDGDQVRIVGSVQFSKYEGKTQIKYQIKNIYSSNSTLDFDAENFEEEASFNQEIVYTGFLDDEENNKTLINTYVIFKNKDFMDFAPQMFSVIPDLYKTNEEKYESLQGMIEAFKELPFGTTIKVNGNIRSFVPQIKVEGEVAKKGWGFKAKGQDTVGGRPVRELEITGADPDTIIESRYSEEDFIVQGSEFGQDVSEESDDLPF